jgi:hypothetical protein
MLGNILCGPRALVLRKHLTTLVLYSLASLSFGRFKTTDVAVVMDHDSPSGSSGSDIDAEDDRGPSGPVSAFREKTPGASRRSMRGLQVAIAEGWLVQRARDMCSFAHDRYRQAAEAEALSLPDDLIAKMSFRVRLCYALSFTLTDERCRLSQSCFLNPLRMSTKLPSELSGMWSFIAWVLFLLANRCLPLLREHNRRGELVSLLIDAGDSAWARGAHEVRHIPFWFSLQHNANAL